jgi:hypothetical protein
LKRAVAAMMGVKCPVCVPAAAVLPRETNENILNQYFICLALQFSPVSALS